MAKTRSEASRLRNRRSASRPARSRDVCEETAICSERAANSVMLRARDGSRSGGAFKLLEPSTVREISDRHFLSKRDYRYK